MKPAQRAILLGGLLPETRALRDAMTVPATASRMSAINRLIRSLKGSGIWERLDVLYLLAAHDEQAGRLNLKAPGTLTLTQSATPATFTADRGFQGNGSSSYLTSTLNISTLGGNFSLDSAVIGAHVYTPNTTASAVDMVVGNARLFSNAGLTAYGIRVNDAGALLSAGAPAVGHYAGRRTVSTGREVWKNGVLSSGPDAVTSTAMASGFFLLAFNAAGGFSNVGLSAAYAGGALTAAQMAEMHTALQTYLQTVGAA